MSMEFYEYENEFQQSSKDVVRLMNDVPKLSGMERKQAIGNVNQILRDMDDLVGRMEDVVREEGGRGEFFFFFFVCVCVFCLFVVCCLLFVVVVVCCCLLFVVCCLLFVVRCFISLVDIVW